jgi:hypothetical protein
MALEGVAMDGKRTCPECGLAFDAPAAEAGPLACPLCGASVPAPPSPAAAESPRPAKSGRHIRTGLVAIAALVFVIGGLAYAVHLLQQDAPKPADQPAATTLAARPAEPLVLQPTMPSVPVDPSAPPARPAPPPTQPIDRATKPPALSPPDPVPGPAPTAEPLAARVNRAIDQGLVCLRRDYCSPDGNGPSGLRSLVGLTLLVCGASPDDPAVRQLADRVRSQQGLSRTYDLALAILFLDRLGDPGDDGMIRLFAGRLAAGQSEAGSWSYECPNPQPLQIQRPLVPHDQVFVPHDQVFVPHDQLFVPHDQLFVPHDQVVVPGQPAVVPPIVHAAPQPKRAILSGDHSNTQFALLGLWVARRHGAPVGAALNRAAQYFLEIQHDDGSWAYWNTGDHSRPSMTCVGLVSLAMANRAMSGEGHYAAPVAKALRFLGGVLDSTSPERGEAPQVEGGYPTYFLWSLERTAVIYDLRTVGNVEWYPWAAEWLVSVQQADGSWQDGLGKPVATCLALLVLKRSNVTLDLVVRRPSAPGDLTGPATDGPIIIQGAPTVLRPDGVPAGTTTRDATPPDLVNGYVAPVKK